MSVVRVGRPPEPAAFEQLATRSMSGPPRAIVVRPLDDSPPGHVVDESIEIRLTVEPESGRLAIASGDISRRVRSPSGGVTTGDRPSGRLPTTTEGRAMPIGTIVNLRA